MPDIALLLLGNPELHVRNRRIDVGVKRFAALAYLALNGKTRRRTLAELLWPDSDNPLNNLAVARNDLSRILGPDGLEVDAQSIGLGPAVQVDVNRWRTATQRRDPEAWGWYRGAFLEDLRLNDWANGLGDEFESWLLETRETLALEQRDFAYHLGLEALRGADFERALGFLKVAHGLAHGLANNTNEEPREDATRWYILTLGAIGQHDAAMTAFANLRQRLLEELEVEPNDQTRQALELARTNPETCRAQIAQILNTRPATKPRREPQREQAPLVGRETQLRELKAHLQQNALERTVILRGESGVGKSRLAQELLEQLPDHVLRFDFNLGQVPHVAIERLVRQLVNTQAEQVQHLPALWRVALSRFVPDLLPDETPPSEPELERMAAYRAIQQLLEPLGPVVVLLEDLQWADAPSLELIGHLRTNPPSGGLRQIVTWRDTETPSAPDATAQAVHTWIRAGALDVGLTGLDETAIAELTRWFNRPEVNPHELREHTAGNPLYITEWLRSDQPQGGLALNQLIYQRINQLGSEAQQILEALAVLGPNTNLGVLQRTSGRSLEQCIQALETTRHANLIQHDETGIRFHHVLTFDVIQSHLNPARRDLLHLRAAYATQGTPLVCAAHYWQAQAVLSEEDHPKAFQSFLEAGVQLGLRGEITEASTWYERAQSQAQTPDERVRVMVTQARTLEQFARYDEANQLLERIWEMLDLVDPVIAATANNVRSDLTIDRYGDVKTGFKYASAAYELLEGVSSVAAQLERGRAKHLLGWCAFRNRNYEEAEQHFKTAMALHDSLGNQADRSSSMIAYGLTQMYLKKDGVKEILEEAASLAFKSNYLTAYGYALDCLGIYHRKNRNFNDAIKSFEEAISTINLISDDFSIGIWFNNLAFVYFEQNNFQNARINYQKALKGRDVQDNIHYLRVVVLGNLAETDIRLSLWPEARLSLEEAIALADEQSVPTLLADLYYWMAELEFLENNLSTAITGYQTSARIAKSNGYSERYALASAKLARLSGDLQLAKDAFSTVDMPEIKASLLFVAGDYATAQQVMSGSHDPYERFRLDLDIAHATNNQSLLKQTLALLPF